VMDEKENSKQIIDWKESQFFMEWLAAGRPRNQISISSICNCHCIFCSNHSNPFIMPKGLFRDIEDIRHQISLMPIHNMPIHMSESLPGRISEGEAFLHPDFFKILRIVRSKYVFNTLKFTTNGSMLDEPFLRELSKYKPVDIMVSMHSMQPALWADIFRKKIEDAKEAINSLALIKKHGLGLSGAIVPLPEICGWQDIHHTFRNLVSSGAQSILFWWPSYSKYTPQYLRDKIRCSYDVLWEFVNGLKQQTDVPIKLNPDCRSHLKLDVHKIMKLTLLGNSQNKCVKILMPILPPK
jgi:hypothetical protein